MPTPLRLRLLRQLACYLLLVPGFLFSQVIIREKVEIKPTRPNASIKGARGFASTVDYFNPPMFIAQSDGTPALTLPSNLTVSAEVDILGAIGGNQQAVVVLVLSPYLEHRLAWKGREPISWGGNMYQGEDPYTGVFNKGTSPNAQLYVFDGQWGTGARERSITEDGLSFSFTSYLNQGTLPRVDVTATATATGSFLPDALFDHWEIRTYPNSLTCGQKSRILFLPFDGANRRYEPYGIPPWDVFVTVSVEAKGDYAYLRCGDQEGSEITVSLGESSPIDLWLDTGRGAIPGDEDIAIVRVTGGGKTGEAQVALFCEKLDHFRITADPEAVNHGNESKLTVIAEDANDEEVIPEEDFDVTFTLSSPDIIIVSMSDTSTRAPQEMLPMFKKETSGTTMLDDDVPLYGSFTVNGGSPQPYTVTVPYSLAREGRVSYYANGQIPYGDGPEAVTVTVEKADNPSKAGSVDVEVTRAQLHHFAVVVTPDTVLFGETAAIKVQAKDKNDVDIEPPKDTQVNIVLAIDEKYGFLVYGGQIGKEILAVPYSDAAGGKVIFSATGENPVGLDPQSVVVGATKVGEESIAGSGRVVVNPTIEKFCQGEGDWAELPYDSYKELDANGNIKQPERPYTIGEKGCALTCMAMVLNAVGLEYDPVRLNEEMTRDRLFTRNGKGNWDGGVVWTAVAAYSSARIKPNVVPLGTQDNWDSKTPIEVEQIDSYLSKDGFVIVLVGNPDRNDPKKVRNHWVLVTGKKNGRYQILDPGCYEGRTSLDSYSNLIYRAIIYERR